MSERFAIRVLSGAMAGKVFPLGSIAFIGSQPHCDIQLTDPGIESLHVRISQKGDSFTAADLTSLPDVKVNDRAIKSRKLKLNDHLTVATTEMEFISVPAEEVSIEAAAQGLGQLTDSTDGGSPGLVGNATSPMSAEEAALVDAIPVTDIRPTSFRPDPLIRDGRRRERQRSLWVFLIVFGGLALVAILIAVSHRRAVRGELMASYEEAATYSKAYPEDLEGTLHRYRDVLEEHRGKHAETDRFLEMDIARLEQAITAREKEFRSLLRSLDQRAQDLEAAERYEEALRVYAVEDPGTRERVQAARKAALAALNVKRGGGGAAKTAEEAPVQTGPAAVERTPEAAPRIDPGLRAEDAARALVDGKTDDVIAQLEDASKASADAGRKKTLDEAISSARLLGTMDRTLAAGSPSGSAKGPPLPDGDSAALTGTLPPVLKAVYAIRGGQRGEAREWLAQAQGQFLADGLAVLAGASADESVAEREAEQGFLKLWQREFKIPDLRVPAPADCAAAVRARLKDGPREERARLCQDLEAFKAQFRATDFARRYEAVFLAAAIPELAGARVSRLAGLGDGHVIDLDGAEIYVEAHQDLQADAEAQIGLCRPVTVYYGMSTNRPVGAWVDVDMLLPMKTLSDRQAVGSLPGDPGLRAPALGDCVVIGKGLRKGRQWIAGSGGAVPVLLYKGDFDKKLDPQWKGTTSFGVEAGRLAVDPGSPEAREREERFAGADLELQINAGSGTVRLELDVTRRPDQAVRVGMGGLEYRIGESGGNPAGIYANGMLLRPFEGPRGVLGVAQRVVLLKAHRMARMEVNESVAECRLPAAAGDSPVSQIRFHVDGKTALDNVQLWRVPGRIDAEVVGVSEDRTRVALSKGAESEWETVNPGTKVFFFAAAATAKTPQAEARVVETAGSWLIAEASSPMTLAADSLVSLKAVRPEPDQPVEVAAEGLTPRRPLIDGVYAKATKDMGDREVTLDSTVAVPAQGAVAAVLDRITNPETSELLAVVPGDASRAEFQQRGLVVTYRAAGFPPPGGIGEGVWISRGIGLAGRLVDLPTYGIGHVPGSTGARRDFWRVTSGDWKDKLGRMVGGPVLLPAGPSVVAMSDLLGGSFQLDLDVRIEREGRQDEREWVRDVMVELYVPAKASGIAFGIGGPGGGGLSVLSHTIGSDRGEKALCGEGSAPKEGVVSTDKTWPAGTPVLKVGSSYTLRIRRTGEAAAVYVNGKRLAYVNSPVLGGDVQLRLAAAEATLSVGRVAGVELPLGYALPAQEPAVGEFGYVLSAAEGRAVIDADMNGIVANRRVSVVSVDKIVQGEQSKTVMMTRVATGMIADVGGRTARVQILEGGPVKRGMKVFCGSLPATLTFTDTRWQDLDQGL